MNFRYTISSLLFLLLLTLPALSQDRSSERQRTRGTISGRVLDADLKDPIPSATVAVWSASDSTLITGAITEKDGRFKIESLGPGLYSIHVSFIGYGTSINPGIRLSRDQMQVELADVFLATDTRMLDEVEIAAERDFMEVGIDRTVYNTKDQLVSAGGSASNVLENIPSVEVDIEGNISLRGSQNVAILINGRPSPMTGEALTAYLQGLPAEVVARVEVIPNPSAKYEPDGMAGILNLVLKQNRDLGLSGSVTTSASSQGSYNGSGNIAYQKGKVTLFAGYGFRYGNRDSEGWRFRENRISNPVTSIDQASFDDRVGLSHNVNTSIDYKLGRFSSLTLTSTLSVRDSEEDGLAAYTELGASDLLASRYDRTTLGTDDDLSTEHRIAFRKIKDPGKEEFVVELEFEREWETEEGNYSQSVFESLDASSVGQLTEQQTDIQDEENTEVSFQLDYMRPLGDEGRLELGLKSDIEQLQSAFYMEALDMETGITAPNLNRNNTFVYDQDIHAAYGIVGTKLGAFGLQAGVRLEQAFTTFDLETTNESFENNYFSIFPSAFAVYEFTENQSLKLAYSKRINRPRTGGRFNQLNPFNSNEDPLFQRIGNPYLKPEYVHAIELSFTQLAEATSLTLTPYFRHTVDEIRFYETLRSDGVSILTFENFDSSNSWGAEAIGTLKQGRKLNAYISLNGYRVVTDGSSVDTGLTNKAFGFSTRANATYNVSPTLALQFSYYYRAPMNIENGRMAARQSADLAVRQKLMGDRANLSLRVRDVFNTMGFRILREDARYYQEIDRSFQSQSIGLSFTYNFGKQQRRRGQNRRAQQSGPDFDEMEM